MCQAVVLNQIKPPSLILFLSPVREIELLRRLDHRNVIKLIEKIYCEEKEKLYIVMEYCYMVLQELIESAPGKKFPIWQSHR